MGTCNDPYKYKLHTEPVSTKDVDVCDQCLDELKRREHYNPPVVGRCFKCGKKGVTNSTTGEVEDCIC